MRRSVLLMVLGASAAIALLYGLRIAQSAAKAAVASLLPQDTIAVVHVPDFNALFDQWHQSDICAIYREPAVQEFLRASANQTGSTSPWSTTAGQMRELYAKDSFIALTSVADNKPTVVGGFRFRCSDSVARRVVDDWKTHIKPAAKREQIRYQQHDIEVFTEGAFSVVLVQDGKWFFASNDTEALKAVLDRADHRVTDRAAILSNDSSFREASAAMPSSYGVMFYLQPKPFAQKLAAVRGAWSASLAPRSQSLIEQIRCVCSTTRFEKGRLHDVVFVGMPQQDPEKIKRSSLAVGTRDTFLYIASLLNLSQQATAFSAIPGTNLLGAGLGKIATALNSAGVTAEDWKAAFGPEAGMVVDWAGESHWPSPIITCAVGDSPRARRIADALARGIDEDAVWEQTDRNGVHFWSMKSQPSLFAIRPVIALSDRALVTGLDEASVEAAIQRAQNSADGLSNSDVYKGAAHLVPEPTNFFAYIDTALLYNRLDATLRPLLIMGAAFMPAINQYVNLGKLPDPAVISRHLSPIVSSQRYEANGYVAESVGPITLNQTGIGIATIATLGAISYQKGNFGLPFPLPLASGSAPGVVPQARQHRRQHSSAPLTPTPSPTP